MQSVSIEGDFLTPKGRVAILATRFNELVVEQLIQGAHQCLRQHGLLETDIEIIRVPGVYELPFAAQTLAKTGRYQGMVALGVVIRGETPHFDFVAGEGSSGLQKVMLEHNLPIGFGVLTTDTIEQALSRSGLKCGNKGIEATLALIEMMRLAEKINE